MILAILGILFLLIDIFIFKDPLALFLFCLLIGVFVLFFIIEFFEQLRIKRLWRSFWTEEEGRRKMKTYKIVNNDISDGYHTFDELYEHRIALFIYALNQGAFLDPQIQRNHFEGWDLILCYTKSGDQISYHIPSGKSNLIKIDLYEDPESLNDWDEHQSSDVVKRLLK